MLRIMCHIFMTHPQVCILLLSKRGASLLSDAIWSRKRRNSFRNIPWHHGGRHI